jgi:LysM repeat protein
MSGRGIGRFLAPLALLACAAAVLLTVRATLQDDPPTPSRPAAERSEEGQDRRSTSNRPSRRRTYTVRSGDTLSQIAEETGVSVERILELNEDIDPQSLNAGDRLRLRR